MSIKSVIARESDGNIQITFTIPFAEIKKAKEETIVEMSKDIEVPGFRKGKAPMSKVAEKIPENTLIEHSLGHILPRALSEAVKENNLKIAVYPRFELIKAKEAEDWQITGTTCELPEIELGNYKDIVAGEIRSASLKKELSREEKQEVTIKALVKNLKVTIPKILIEEEADGRLSTLLQRLEKLGLSLESYLASIGKKPEEIRAEYANQSREAITLDLILSKIAGDQNLQIDAKEVETTMKAAGEKDESPERKRLIESVLRRRAALDFLTNLS